MQRFRSMRTLQKFSSVYDQVQNHFNLERPGHPTGLQAETFDRIGRVVGSRGIGCCSRTSTLNRARTFPRPFR